MPAGTSSWTQQRTSLRNDARTVHQNAHTGTFHGAAYANRGPTGSAVPEEPICTGNQRFTT